MTPGLTRVEDHLSATMLFCSLIEKLILENLNMEDPRAYDTNSYGSKDRRKWQKEGADAMYVRKQTISILILGQNPACVEDPEGKSGPGLLIPC